MKEMYGERECGTGLNTVESMGRTEGSHSHKFKSKAVSRLVCFSTPMGKEKRDVSIELRLRVCFREFSERDRGNSVKDNN